MQQVVVICTDISRHPYQFHPQGSRIRKKACCCDLEFIQGRVWAVKILSSVISANGVDASGWERREHGSLCSLGWDVP